MTRMMSMAVGTAFCAALLVAAPPNMWAQTRTATKAAPAKAAQAKPAPARTVAVTTKVAVAPVEAGSVTMIGCLEADGRSYMLTDIEGAQAPKGRSWKTGFVTKTSKKMELMASPSVKFGDHIGHKVSVVGVKSGDSRLTARSIRQLAGSCS